MSKKEIKELQEHLHKFGIELSKKDHIVDHGTFIVWNDLPAFFIYEKNTLPTLKCALKHELSMPSIYVDKGAIPFIIKGADIMRPGITRADVFPKDSFVIVRDETYGKPLAIGYSMLSSENLMAQEKGKVIKNLHFVGDDLWNA